MSRPATSLRVQTIPRFALRRDEAAASLGLSPATFDNWINEGHMPKGRRIGGLVLWDAEEIRERWHALRDGVMMRNPLDRMVI